MITEEILKQEYITISEKILFAGENYLQIVDKGLLSPSRLETIAFLSAYQGACQLLLLSQLYERYFGRDVEGIVSSPLEMQKRVDRLSQSLE